MKFVMSVLISLGIIVSSGAVHNARAESIQNLGNSQYKNWYLDIDGSNGHVVLSQNLKGTGAHWKITEGPNGISIQNMCNCSFRDGFLSMGDDGQLWVTYIPVHYWKITKNGSSSKIQSMEIIGVEGLYVDIDGNGGVVLESSPKGSGTNWLIH
jgi:hypothetical protein